MKAKIVFETRPVRHVAIQCPNCEKWFYGYEITNDTLRDIIDVEFAHYKCPVCGEKFNGINNLDYTECADAYETYKDCLTKKVTWD